ncbi:MAG: sodium:alanine symporter family protein [Clostridiales bacterium]|nr:sodium:alanine symporter family protein [Clostridiales bacterium]
MLQTIETINGTVNDFVWGVPAMICIIGVGLVLSFRTGFIQFRKFGYALKNSIGRIFKKEEAKKGSITPFQAVCTALAATVGTGNIAGVAGAIAIGGPGAVFWMWISALLGMCTKFSEVTLAVYYREKNKEGDYVGGPMYYIKNGLGQHWKWMAVLYALLGSLTVMGTGNATQVNTITTSINSALINYGVINDSQVKTVSLVIGIVIAILVAIVLLGGVKRIGSVTEKLVPFMAVLYIILALGVVFFNVSHVPAVFTSIFAGAFNPSAFTGGVVGSLFIAMRRGVSRGIFSNEAGIGTGSIAHACADADQPVKQGMFGIFEVFADTIVICTLTALVILCSGVGINYGEAAGAELTISGFTATYGNWVSIFTAIAMCCFAFSTILGWGLYGARCIEFVFSHKVVKPFMLVYSLVAILGATVDLGLVWGIADTCNGLMVIPNLIALFLLSGTVVKLVREHFSSGKA